MDVSEVQSALKPLFDSGVVVEVGLGGFAAYNGSPPLSETIIVVFVRGEHPEQHESSIQRLVNQVGVEGVLLRIEQARRG